MINIKQIAKFVVGLGDKVAPTDIEEGMRVGFVGVLIVRRHSSLESIVTSIKSKFLCLLELIHLLL